MIDVRIDDLAFFEGDAIAWPVTAELAPPTALMRRVADAAGPALAKQLQLQEPLAVGSAIVTGAGDLEVDLLVHAVVSSRTEPVTRDTVRRATMSALHRADAWAIDKLAMAPFGLGAGNLDPEASAEVMLDVISTFMRTGRKPHAVTIVVENAAEFEAFTSLIPRT